MPTWQRALAVLCCPNRMCSESSGGKGTEGAQQSPSRCWAILSGLPGALTASLENSIHPLPAGKCLLCISALSWLSSRHQAGCWKGFCKRRQFCQRISSSEIHFLLRIPSCCSFTPEDPQWDLGFTWKDSHLPKAQVHSQFSRAQSLR